MDSRMLSRAIVATALVGAIAVPSVMACGGGKGPSGPPGGPLQAVRQEPLVRLGRHARHRGDRDRDRYRGDRGRGDCNPAPSPVDPPVDPPTGPEL